MTDTTILQVSGMTVRYGPKVAVSDMSLRVDRGEVVTLLGANGAGKSTTLMTLSGFRPVSAGRVTYQDRDLHGVAPARIARMGMVHVPEGRRVLPGMTVAENLQLGAACARRAGRAPGELDWILERFPVLVTKRDVNAGLLSGGEQQMLVIGRALMASPHLLLLDEPSLGLAPIMIHAVFDVLREIKADGVTMLLVEQNVREGLGLADRAYVLERGHVVKEGTGAELLDDDLIQAAYLGGAAV